MLSRSFLASALLLSVSVLAAPAREELFTRQSIAALSAAQIEAFTPFTHFASTAYCSPSTTINWSCGANCNANADFVPTASGGDESDTPFWYVGFSPSQATVIVAHQGTDSEPTQIEADGEVVMKNLDSSLFPGLSSSIEAHSGFANEQAKTATTILAAVNSTIAAHSAKQVTVVGHSPGAAIALLDGIYLHLHISGVSFKIIGYGMPRVGNQAFANYVDSVLPRTLTRVNNKEDPIPIFPGQFLGYHHPSGEVHILDDNQWVACPGQDNESIECTTGDVPNPFEGNTNDHAGPYNGITMGC